MAAAMRLNTKLDIGQLLYENGDSQEVKMLAEAGEGNAGGKCRSNG